MHRIFQILIDTLYFRFVTNKTSIAFNQFTMNFNGKENEQQSTPGDEKTPTLTPEKAVRKLSVILEETSLVDPYENHVKLYPLSPVQGETVVFVELGPYGFLQKDLRRATQVQIRCDSPLVFQEGSPTEQPPPVMEDEADLLRDESPPPSDMEGVDEDILLDPPTEPSRSPPPKTPELHPSTPEPKQDPQEPSSAGEVGPEIELKEQEETRENPPLSADSVPGTKEPRQETASPLHRAKNGSHSAKRKGSSGSEQRKAKRGRNSPASRSASSSQERGSVSTVYRSPLVPRPRPQPRPNNNCLLYTSDAADD